MAFLHGCATAGGKTKRWRGNPVPEEQSIGASFNRQGADAVVGWKDSQYSGALFGVFNKHFWKALHDGKSVAQAVKEAKDSARSSLWWWLASGEERAAIEKVVIFGDGNLKL